MKENQSPENLKAALNELECINRVIDRICRVRETNHIMSIIISELIDFTSSDQGVINLISQYQKTEPVTVIRKKPPQSEGTQFKVDGLIVGWVLKHKRLLKIDDLDTDERFSGLSSEEGRLKSILCCPMIVRGEIIGITSLVKDAESGPFADDQSRLAGIIVSQSAPILGNSLLLEELARKNELLELSKKRLQDENIRLRLEIDSDLAFENIVGKSESMKNVLTLVSKFSSIDSPVLITGPTGTGKELIAKAIHYNSGRKDKPFVVKNCGVKTESLLEAELFGYVKGAFTGADRDKPGLFKEADGGTIFLDEIGDAPAATQVAILRVLESGELRPVGATRTEFVDVRIVSATNKDLKSEIEKGTFRQDLFYRLNTFVIDLPPLSQRRDDIPLLVNHFLNKLKVKLNWEKPSITPEALKLLTSCSWPGNVRQLENEIERASVVCGPDRPIGIADLSPELLDSIEERFGHIDFKGQLKTIVEKVEREVISGTLKENDGNIMRTSKILGLTRKGLRDKMARYGIKNGK
jgi:Nif-specific regulatory protein